MTQSRGKNKTRHAISKLLKTKDKNLEDNQRNMTSYLRRNEDKNYNRLLIRNHKKMKWHFKVLKKNLSIHYTQPKKKKVFQKSMRHTFLKKKKGILIVKHL